MESAESGSEHQEARCFVRGGEDGVSHEEALLLPDEEHSDDEGRFLLLGLSGRLRSLVVCHCYRQDDEVIRVISARKANAIERQQYEDRRMI